MSHGINTYLSMLLVWTSLYVLSCMMLAQSDAPTFSLWTIWYSLWTWHHKLPILYFVINIILCCWSAWVSIFRSNKTINLNITNVQISRSMIFETRVFGQTIEIYPSTCCIYIWEDFFVHYSNSFTRDYKIIDYI